MGTATGSTGKAESGELQVETPIKVLPQVKAGGDRWR